MVTRLNKIPKTVKFNPFLVAIEAPLHFFACQVFRSHFSCLYHSLMLPSFHSQFGNFAPTTASKPPINQDQPSKRRRVTQAWYWNAWIINACVLTAFLIYLADFPYYSDACRSKKIKCLFDPTTNSCSTCHALDTTCVFTKP